MVGYDFGFRRFTLVLGKRLNGRGGQTQTLGEQLIGEPTATSGGRGWLAAWTQLVDRELWRRRWALGLL